MKSKTQEFYQKMTKLLWTQIVTPRISLTYHRHVHATKSDFSIHAYSSFKERNCPTAQRKWSTFRYHVFYDGRLLSVNRKKLSHVFRMVTPNFWGQTDMTNIVWGRKWFYFWFSFLFAFRVAIVQLKSKFIFLSSHMVKFPEDHLTKDNWKTMMILLGQPRKVFLQVLNGTFHVWMEKVGES